MPVGRVSTRREITAVVVALGGIVLAVVALFVLLGLARSGDVQMKLGSDTFAAGRTDRMAERIASGGPFLYSDISGGTRDLYLNHLGATPDTGWVAFAARAPGSPRECYLRWQAGADELVDTCSGATYPADGTGLEQFPVFVSNGQLTVDINRTAERRAQEQPATTSSVIESGIPRSALSTAPPLSEPPSTVPATTAPLPGNPSETTAPPPTTGG